MRISSSYGAADRRTRHLIGRAELACMKPDGILINVSRGPVVERCADGGVSQADDLRGRADVTDPEPLPRDIRSCGSISDHRAALGSATVETRERMAQVSIENLLAGLAGRVWRFGCCRRKRLELLSRKVSRKLAGRFANVIWINQ